MSFEYDLLKQILAEQKRTNDLLEKLISNNTQEKTSQRKVKS